MKRALFVDDDQGISKAISSFRGYFGTQLLFARGLSDAIEILKTHEIGLVISDHHIPGGEGKDLHEHLEALHPAAELILYSNIDEHPKEELMALISKHLSR